MKGRSANPKKTSIPVLKFLKASNVKPNFLLVIDTHSDVATGYLQHSAVKSSVAAADKVSLFYFHILLPESL
jgi:hypothetical protein